MYFATLFVAFFSISDSVREGSTGYLPKETREQTNVKQLKKKQKKDGNVIDVLTIKLFQRNTRTANNKDGTCYRLDVIFYPVSFPSFTSCWEATILIAKIIAVDIYMLWGFRISSNAALACNFKRPHEPELRSWPSCT